MPHPSVYETLTTLHIVQLLCPNAYNTIHLPTKTIILALYVLCQQAKSEPRKKFCDVLDGVGYIYGTDLFESLSQAGDMAAYLELEE